MTRFTPFQHVKLRERDKKSIYIRVEIVTVVRLGGSRVVPLTAQRGFAEINVGANEVVLVTEG